MRIQNLTVVLLILLSVAAGLLTACRASTSSPTSPLSPLSPVVTPSSARPSLADGATLLAERCTSCHNLDRVTGARREREEWAQIIARMVGRGAELSEAERAILLDYLAQTYSP